MVRRFLVLYVGDAASAGMRAAAEAVKLDHVVEERVCTAQHRSSRPRRLECNRTALNRRMESIRTEIEQKEAPSDAESWEMSSHARSSHENATNGYISNVKGSGLKMNRVRC
jgi:hypothetical protein